MCSDKHFLIVPWEWEAEAYDFTYSMCVYQGVVMDIRMSFHEEAAKNSKNKSASTLHILKTSDFGAYKECEWKGTESRMLDRQGHDLSGRGLNFKSHEKMKPGCSTPWIFKMLPWLSHRAYEYWWDRTQLSGHNDNQGQKGSTQLSWKQICRHKYLLNIADILWFQGLMEEKI